jgi:hypothetical protein
MAEAHSTPTGPKSVTCRYCGLPFRVSRVEPGRDYFCCTGCAVLGRVPVDASGNFPVNAHLVSALSVGFLYFNQLLCWGVAVLLARQGRLDLSNRFTWISTAVALLAWAAVVVIQARERVLRGKDIVFGLLTLLQLWVGLTRLPSGLWIMAGGNAIWLIWAFRGLLRKRVSR